METYSLFRRPRFVVCALFLAISLSFFRFIYLLHVYYSMKLRCYFVGFIGTAWLSSVLVPFFFFRLLVFNSCSNPSCALQFVFFYMCIEIDLWFQSKTGEIKKTEKSSNSILLWNCNTFPFYLTVCPTHSHQRNPFRFWRCWMCWRCKRWNKRMCVNWK